MKSTGQIQVDLGILHKIPGQYCSKLLSSSKSRDIQDIVKARDMMKESCVPWMGAYNKNYSKKVYFKEITHFIILTFQ